MKTTAFRRLYRIIRYRFWYKVVMKKFGPDWKPKCKKCGKRVELFQEYAIIGPYRWWGVHCHGRYGVMKVGSTFMIGMPSPRFRLYMIKAFDDSNQAWSEQVRKIPISGFGPDIPKLELYNLMFTKIRAMMDRSQDHWLLEALKLILDEWEIPEGSRVSSKEILEIEAKAQDILCIKILENSRKRGIA